MKNKKSIIINLISGPGAGKSTTAAGIFHELKKKEVEVEMSLEFAKDKLYEQSYRTMDNQLYVFGKQHHRLWRLADKVDVIVTDSPLLISLYYNKEDSKYFNDFVVEQYHKFNNLLYFINRSDYYQQTGRLQTKEESEQIDREIKNLLEKYNISYREVSQDEAVSKIVEEVLKLLENGE